MVTNRSLDSTFVDHIIEDDYCNGFLELIGSKCVAISCDSIESLLAQIFPLPPSFLRSALMASSPSNTSEDKLKHCFAAFDFDDSGFLDRQEMRKLFLVIYALGGKQLKTKALLAMADRALTKLDRNGDCKLSFDEFLSIAHVQPFIMETVALHIPTLCAGDGVPQAEHEIAAAAAFETDHRRSVLEA